MVRPDGLVKVLDFGLAQPVEAAAGGAFGTPRYMAPEQARGEPAVSASDVFSLAKTLRECLGGVNPPRAMDALLDRAMSDDASRRPSAKEFAAALRTFAEPSTPTWRRWLEPLAAVAAVLAAIGAAVFWPVREASPGQPVVVPVTSRPGDKLYPAFSPDGERFVYAWRNDAANLAPLHLYAQSVKGGEPVQLTFGEVDDHMPSWSRDGAQIAFQRTEPGGFAVYVIPAGGGVPRRICRSGFGLDWLTDGKHLIVSTPWGKGIPSAIALVSLETGEVRELPTAFKHSSSFVSVSPDGSKIAAVRHITQAGRDVFVMNADGSGERRLTSDMRAVWGVAWAADARDIVFSSNRTGPLDLWRVPSSGGEPRRVFSGQWVQYPAISRAAGRLLFTEQFAESNLYRFDGPRFDRDTPIVPGNREDHSADISPDGSRIVFVSRRTGSYELWICDANGGNQRQLTFIGAAVTGSPRWSPDGRWIAFDSRRAGGSEIYLISPDGGEPRRLLREWTESVVPAWSRDSKWIYFSSDVEGDRTLFRVRVDDPEKRERVADGPVISGNETADSRYFYYSRNNVIFRKTTGPDIAAAREEEVMTVQMDRCWAISGDSLYYCAAEKGHWEIRRRAMGSRIVEKISEMKERPQGMVPALTVSPNGQWFVYARLDSTMSDILSIEDFR